MHCEKTRYHANQYDSQTKHKYYCCCFYPIHIKIPLERPTLNIKFLRPSESSIIVIMDILTISLVFRAGFIFDSVFTVTEL